MSTPRQRLLPEVLKPVPDYLQRFGALWPHAFRLSPSDVDHGVGCGLLRRQPVEFLGLYTWILFPGMHARQYLPADAPFLRPPVVQKATELACLVDLERRYLQDGQQSTVDRRRRALKTYDAEDEPIIVMVRVVTPALWTLRRNMADFISREYRTIKDPIRRREIISPLLGAKALVLYVPATTCKALTKSAETAGLFRHNHLKIVGFDGRQWPPDNV